MKKRKRSKLQKQFTDRRLRDIDRKERLIFNRGNATRKGFLGTGERVPWREIPWQK